MIGLNRGAVAMLLYEQPLSSYAQKIKIALREKNIPFDMELPETFGTPGRRADYAGSLKYRVAAVEPDTV